MYVLRPSYSDMKVVKLGTSIRSIRKSFFKHFEDVLDEPDSYMPEYVSQVKKFLDTQFKTTEALIKAYKEIDEDYYIDEVY